jgi:hypothetical protein
LDEKEKRQISRGDFLFKNERNFCGGFLLFSMHTKILKTENFPSYSDGSSFFISVFLHEIIAS